MIARAAANLGEPLDAGTPIIVLRRSLDKFQHCALAVARTAGRQGVAVHTVSPGRMEPAMRSRYMTGTVALPAAASDADWIQAVLALRSHLAGAILLPVDDVAAVTVDSHQEKLSEHFRLPLAPAGVRRRLASKRELHLLCVELGLPSPDSRFPTSEAELEREAAALGYPLILKRSDPWLPPRDAFAPSVAIAYNARQAREAYEAMESDVAPQIMLQEYIPGGPESVWMFNGYFGAAASCLCAFTGRKLRQRGSGTGPTTLGECLPNPAVETNARRLLQELDYRGIVDMGFRFDRRDGLYKLLDVNPRLGSTFRLFAGSAGIDVVRAMHLDLTGRPVLASRAIPGRRWIDDRSDPVSAARMIRRGELTPSEWARSLRGVNEAAWWAADDPAPFAAMFGQSGPAAWRMLAGRRLAGRRR
jgi:D-aspartate ligase